jgi:outer membrane protein assembly factor BamE
VRQSSDSFLGLITPYRIDIVQGNVVTREQAAQLRPGMSRLQVREIVGTPLVADLFHADRWDYIFTIRRPGTEPQRRSVVLLFDGETLKSVEAPDLPTEREFVASITRERKIEPRVLELTEAQRKALPAPPRAEAPAAGSASPPRDYPPLEAS